MADVDELVREAKALLAREKPAGPMDSSVHERLLLTLHSFVEREVPPEHTHAVLLAVDEAVHPPDLGLVVTLTREGDAEAFAVRMRWRVGPEEADRALARARVRAEQLRTRLRRWQERQGEIEELRSLLDERRRLRRALEERGASASVADLQELARVQAALAEHPPENLKELRSSTQRSLARDAEDLLRALPRYLRP